MLLAVREHLIQEIDVLRMSLHKYLPKLRVPIHRMLDVGHTDDLVGVLPDARCSSQYRIASKADWGVPLSVPSEPSIGATKYRA